MDNQSAADARAGNAEKGVATQSQKSKSTCPSPLSAQPPAISKDALKGFGALVALLIAGVALWHFWRPIVCLSSFLGTWIAFATFSLKANRGKIHSVGGGLVLGLLALILAVKLFGGHKETNPGEDKQALAVTDAKEGRTQNALGSEPRPTFPMTAQEFRAAFNKVSSYQQIGSLANKTIDGKPWLVCALNDESRLEISVEPATDRIREVVCGFTKNQPGSSDAYFLASKVTQTLSQDVTWGEASHFVDGLASGADGSKKMKAEEELFRNLIVSMDSMGTTNSGLPIVVLDFMPNGFETSREGIRSLLWDLQAGRVDLAKLKKTLIIETGGAAFIVESSERNYVFYGLRSNARSDTPVQFAIIRKPDSFYGEGSALHGKYFQAVGVETFTTVSGAGKDLLVLRPVE